MNQQNNREVDLFQLGIEILKEWRFVLVMVLLLGILIGGGKTVIGLHKLHDTEYMKTQAETVNEAQNKYDELKTLYETQLENIKKELESKEVYRASSIYLNLDPYNVYKESVSYYISTDYQIMPGMVFQNTNPLAGILQAYVTCIDDSDIYRRVIAEKHYNTSVASLRELVEVTAEPEKNMFTVSVIGWSEEAAQAILEAIQEKIAVSGEQIREAIGEYSIEEVARVTGVAVDMTLLDVLAKNNDAITKLQETQTRKQKELNELVEPNGKVLTKETVMNNALKYGMLGGILGGMIAGIWICFQYVAKDPLPDASTLHRIYGVRVIGTYRESGKRRVFSFIDKLVEKLESSAPSEFDIDRAYAIAAANIAAVAEKDTKVLLAGNLAEQKMHSTYISIENNLDGAECFLMEGRDVLENPDTISMLPKTDVVVLVEDMKKTSNTRFAKELDAVQAAGKQIVGVIEVYVG